MLIQQPESSRESVQDTFSCHRHQRNPNRYRGCGSELSLVYKDPTCSERHFCIPLGKDSKRAGLPFRVSNSENTQNSAVGLSTLESSPTGTRLCLRITCWVWGLWRMEYAWEPGSLTLSM